MSDPRHGEHPPENIVRLDDPAAGLDGYIVIHSTRLGPAAGGCRLWSYDSSQRALDDALRLARGMAFKNAMAGLPLGGGKAVLRRPEGDFDRRALFAAFARAVEKLSGDYITAEDVGTTVEDMAEVRQHTRYVAGLSPRENAPGGDPSPWTAIGVFESIRVATRFHLDKQIGDMSVAVQGLGQVGYALCSLLHSAGARLIVADRNDTAAERAKRDFGAEAVDCDRIDQVRADIFAPCALGGVLSAEVAAHLHAKLVCGAANNQLSDQHVAGLLDQRGILYVPDFVVNAGGIINVAGEYLGWSQNEVEAKIGLIGSRVEQLLTSASDSRELPAAAADRIATEIIKGASHRSWKRVA